MMLSMKRYDYVSMNTLFVIFNDYTGGELRNGVNGFLTSYASDSVRFS